MFITPEPSLPSTAKLVRATLLAIVVAGLLLITTVMPAEYGIDPSGVGRLLGLTKLSESSNDSPASTTETRATSTVASDANALLAEKAKTAFGANKGQSFDANANALQSEQQRSDTMTLTLAPGKGAEIKAHLQQGAGMVYLWKATGEVAVDMHGERPDVKGAWTSYAVEAAQQQAQGTFIAPFEGTHGWYWLNQSDKPIDVQVDVVGFQTDLYRP